MARDMREIDLRLNHSARLLMIKRSEIAKDIALRCKHLTPKDETYFIWNYVYVEDANAHLVNTMNTPDSLFNFYH